MESLDFFLELGVRFLKGDTVYMGFILICRRKNAEENSLAFYDTIVIIEGAHLSFFPVLFHTVMIGWIIFSIRNFS